MRTITTLPTRMTTIGDPSGPTWTCRDSLLRPAVRTTNRIPRFSLETAFQHLHSLSDDNQNYRLRKPVNPTDPIGMRRKPIQVQNLVGQYKSWSVDGADQSQTDKDAEFDFVPTNDDFFRAEMELDDPRWELFLGERDCRCALTNEFPETKFRPANLNPSTPQDRRNSTTNTNSKKKTGSILPLTNLNSRKTKNR